jgi:hypothetical protein
MGPLNRDLILQHHSGFAHAETLARLFKRLNPNPHANGAAAAELARLVRAQWHADWTAQEFAREVGVLRDRLEMYDSRVAELESNLAMLKETRRYRFGAAFARPLDTLRNAMARRRDVPARRRAETLALASPSRADEPAQEHR